MVDGIFIFAGLQAKNEEDPASHMILYREMRRFVDIYKAKVLKLTEEMWIDSWSNLRYMVSEREKFSVEQRNLRKVEDLLSRLM